ncbi:MAG: histone deacetylase family protein [Deltaproteobacteria bacterium]|nr:MAG: histone deacetylase family protein [Deltaproteobacteria bacterium]
MTLAFVSHPDCLLHEMGEGHPERPERLGAIEDRLLASRLDWLVSRFDAPEATRAQLLRVHEESYLDSLESIAPRAGLVEIDPDTAMNPQTLRAARRAAGAAVLATDLVIGGKASAAFCSVRPPGHHATRSRAMGFCFYDNVAVAAAHALEQHGLARVAIADFDVHHGNGTEDIFRNDPRVLMVSTFQHPFYPESGIEGRSERMVNVPLGAGAGGAVFREAVTREWLPALDRFQPQMIFVSAGFDGHRDDGMAMLRLVESDYAWVTEVIRSAAIRYAAGRIVSVLEGGYDLSVLGRCVEAHLRALLGP